MLITILTRWRLKLFRASGRRRSAKNKTKQNNKNSEEGRDSRDGDRRLAGRYARRRLSGPASLRVQVEMPYRQLTRVVVGGCWVGVEGGGGGRGGPGQGMAGLMRSPTSCRLLHAKASFLFAGRLQLEAAHLRPPTGLMLLLHTFSVSSRGGENSAGTDDNQAICCFVFGFSGFVWGFLVLCSSNQ